MSALLTPYSDAEIAERARAMAAAEARRVGGNRGDSWGIQESTKGRKKDC